MEGCYKCMKYLMVGFNLLVLVSVYLLVCALVGGLLHFAKL